MTPNDIAKALMSPIRWTPEEGFSREPELGDSIHPQLPKRLTEAKPYRPLVNIRHYGQNSHWSGRGQR